MSILNRIFILDSYLNGNEIIIVGLNDVLVKVELTIGFDNHTYCLVFDEDAFRSLMSSFKESSVAITERGLFSSSNKSIFECMMSDEPLIRPGKLMELTSLTHFPALKRFLKNNNHHKDIYNYSRFFDKPLNVLAMQYSLRLSSRKFTFVPLMNRYCEFKGRELFDVKDVEDDWPFKKLPLVVLDLEVVAKRLETFPMGLKSDEMISHLAVVVQYQDKEFTYVLVVQGAHPIQVEKTATRVVIPLRSEFELLKQFAVDFMSHKFLYCFGLPKTMAFLLSGYNIDNFDLPYLYTRFLHYGLVDLANILTIKNGISDSAFSFDLWHAENRVFVGIQNCSLKKVAQTFLNETKLPLNVMAIRRLYNGDHENLDFSKPAEKCYYYKDGTLSNVPTARYFIDYNIQDCLLIPKLFKQQGILDLLHRMCLMCNLPYYEAIACGNSKRLEYLMVMFALNRQSWLLPLSNLHLAYNKEESILHQIQNIDTNSRNLNDITQLCKTYLLTGEELDMDTEQCMVRSLKGFSGGANDARRHIGRYVFGLDAQSFYPSIIQEFNLDLNNVVILHKKDIPVKFHLPICQNNYVFAYEGSTTDVIDVSNWQWPQLKDLTTYQGLVLIIFRANSMLKALVQQLLNDRKTCKDLLKLGYNATIKAKELCYKTMSCCVFGVLGYKDFTFERIFVAAAITFLARHLLRFCIKEAKALGISIVYVDTDGIMCHSPNVETQEDVNRLSAVISNKLGFPAILFKPESIYDFSNILSCKKYITVLDGEVSFKGFEKNAVAPVKKCLQTWFRLYFNTLDQYDHRSYSVQVNGPQLILAAFTFLSKLKLPHTDWSITKTVTENSSSLALTDFYNYLIEQGTAVGDRVNIIPILDAQDQEEFCLEDMYANETINFKFLLRNYIQYLVAFSNSDSVTITNRTVNTVWDNFLGGCRMDFENVEINVEEKMEVV